MRLPRFRIRTLMLMVAVAAALLWGGPLAPRWFRYYRLAHLYAEQERGWREIALQDVLSNPPDPAMAAFHRECVQYFEFMTRKYRHAMWHPWTPIPPDPYAPGADPAKRR